jgi:predicted MFS family arabinose efflux permease
MLAVGQILTIANTKLVYLVSLGIFELGSLFCAVAQSIEFLIFGRAVAGVGAAGYV